MPELRYIFPHDDGENDRLDQFHYMIYKVLLRKPHQGRLPSRGACAVLDVGYGTGYWLADMGALYPHAELFGIDLAPLVRDQMATGRDTHHLNWDYEQPQWPLAEGSLDLIHMSGLCGSVANWDHLYLKPGTGRLEIIEIDWQPRCDDGTLPLGPNDAFTVWWDTMRSASARLGKPIQYPHHLPQALEQIGFEVEKNDTIRIQSWEYGDDEYDELTAEAARWYVCAMGKTPNDDNRPLRSFSGMSMELFTRVEGWTADQVERLQEALYDPVERSSVHLYHRL
ncbi:hypothetical protein LTR62_003046 [Meristemomyces frigidus]|uniref:S-adenosyl-L-methionine-dependent methyltransferase n=1 Tax=Meristemomyces frigidus TaxID=1508187 RepID=A0AAN7YPX6_9PEZI|nr:hypothetical protein LTR62_003046 [Meristemomyces frigidus]